MSFGTDAKKWITMNEIFGSSGGASDLDGLSDVTITSAASGDMLHNDGAGQFVNTKTFTGDYTFDSATLDSVINIPNGGVKVKYLAINSTPSSTYGFKCYQDALFQSQVGIGVAPSSTIGLKLTENHASGGGFKYGIFVVSALSSTTGGASVRGMSMNTTYNSVSGNTHKLYGAEAKCQFNVPNRTVGSGETFVGGLFQFLVLASADNTTLDSVVDSVAGGEFVYTSDSSSLTGFSCDHGSGGVFKLEVGGSNTLIHGDNLSVRAPRASFSGGAITNYRGIRVHGHAAGVNDPTITNSYGLVIEDMTAISATINDAIHIESQDGANQSATNGNIRFSATDGGGNWNTGHHQIGNAHIWFDGSTLYGKTSAPTGPTDGTDLMGGGGGGGDSFLEWAA